MAKKKSKSGKKAKASAKKAKKTKKAAKKSARKSAKRGRAAKPAKKVKKAARKPAKKKAAAKKPAARKPAAPKPAAAASVRPAMPRPAPIAPSAPVMKPAAPLAAVASVVAPRPMAPPPQPPAHLPFDEPLSEPREAEDVFDDGDEEGGEDDDEVERRGRALQQSAGSARGQQAAPAGGVAYPKVGAVAPDFELPDESNRPQRLSEYRGRRVVLYFYPKDDTPGCTAEACGFRDSLGEFETRNVAVLGISPDSVDSHRLFAARFGLTFPLLADVGHKVAAQYGVWREKLIYGKPQMGIVRTTFIIDARGRIEKVFENVRPEKHEQQVLEWLLRGEAVGASR